MIDTTKYYEMVCQCKCGGRIANGVSIAFAANGTLVVMGFCADCKKSTSAVANMLDLMMEAKDTKGIN